MRSQALPRFHALVFLIALISVAATGLDKFADDPGVGWHLKTGEWIATHSAVPHVDPFLAGGEARPWVSDQWLSDLVLWKIYDLFGFPALYALLSALYLFVYFAPLAGSLRFSGRPAIAATLGALFAAKIAQVHLILRPVMLGIFCFALLFCAMLPFYRSAVKGVAPQELVTRAKKLYWIVPLGFVFWANLHPSFFLGLLFVLLVLLGLFLDLFFFCTQGEEESLRVRQRMVLTILILSALATVLNPYGIALHRSILSLTSSSFFMTYHQEWNPPQMNSPEGQLFQLMLACVFLSFFARPKTATMVDFLVIVLFVHSSLGAVRFLPFFGIIAAPYIADSFSIFSRLGRFPGKETLQSAWLRIEERERRIYPGTNFVAFVTIVFAVCGAIQGAVPFYGGEYGPRAKIYPYRAIEVLAGQSGTTVVAADPFYGGFITWKGGGKALALIDDRNTLLGEEFYKNFEKYLGGAGGWREYFKALGAGYLMYPAHSKREEELLRSNELPVFYRDATATVFGL